jgi:ribosomal protein L11 methyltransferase
VRRYSLRVPAAAADAALARMLELFPAGIVEEAEGDAVVFAGYAASPPGPGLDEADVAPGWEDAWRAFHRPVRVGPLWVGPPWAAAEEIAVVIDPGRAFGTGGHGSTRAALGLLVGLEPGAVLDLGCGSGVLAVAAARLGFGPVHAFDVDPMAVEATAENAARNEVAVTVASADVLADPLPAAPLWLANLELKLLERLMRRPDVPEAVVASGLLASETLGGHPRVEVDGWAAEVLRR